MKKINENLPRINVRMLGSFSLEVDWEIVLEDRGQTRKVWNLFSYLIINRNRVLGPSELPEILCSDERSDDPAKAVKNLAYRLRCLLADSRLPEANYILQSGGTYRWNPDIPLTVDAEQFEETWKKAKTGDGEDAALEKYLEALNIYEGKFLPGFIYEEWVVSYAVQYQRIYRECVANACDILKAKGEYGQIVPICEKAIQFDPFDEEIYRIYIQALIDLERQSEALAAYEVITGRLYSEMGVSPSKELTALYRGILKFIKNVETDLQAIKSDLNEQGRAEGTYYCEYEIFKDIYRFIARGVDRTGDSIFIMLCTITDREDSIPATEHIGKAMDRLREVISDALRKGDLFAKYSYAQYVLMLPGTSYENGVMIGERILQAYKKAYTSKFIKLHYKIQPLDPKTE